MRTYTAPGLRAARGARWLDERVPTWHELVNPATLDIQSGTRCVIAQVAGGSFSAGLNQLDPDHTIVSLKGYGFYDDYLPWYPSRSDAEELERAWRREIYSRRYGTTNPPVWARLRVRLAGWLRKAARWTGSRY